jgi:hypothetical protein
MTFLRGLASILNPLDCYLLGSVFCLFLKEASSITVPLWSTNCVHTVAHSFLAHLYFFCLNLSSTSLQSYSLGQVISPFKSLQSHFLPLSLGC